MELTPKQQALELIHKAKRILLVTHENPDGDAIGSIAALYAVLGKLGKTATAVVWGQIKSSYQFIPKVEELAREMRAVRDFVISVDCANAAADKLVYNFQDGKLNIVITPKTGNFHPQDVTFAEGNFQFDLIIVLDNANWDLLGSMYANHPQLFQTVPVVNIDHHSSNEYYGTVNLVDLTAASTTEILVGLIEALGPSLIDEDIATCLLTGIISDTGSFQHNNTTPKSLTVAAQMVGLGARQQEIIKHLFKTKAYTTLKLWGKILSQLQYDAEHKLSWAAVPYELFAETGATTEETGGLIDELMTSVPGAEIILLLSEKEPRVISGGIRTKKGVDAAEVAVLFGGGGHPGAAGFKLADLSINQAEEIVLNKIREYQSKRLAGYPPTNEATPKEETLVAEPEPEAAVSAHEVEPTVNTGEEMGVAKT